MVMKRGAFLKTAFLPVVAPAGLLSQGFLNPAYKSPNEPVSFFVPRSYDPDISDARLSQIQGAVLQFMADSFPTAPLPLWKRPLAEIDMGFRLQVTLEHLARGVSDAKEVFPVDPVWVLSQILAESWLFDGAISNASAVGLCQITPVAAREYGLLLASDLPEHRREPFLLPELASTLEEMERLQKDRQDFVKTHRPKPEITYDEMLTAVAAGTSADLKDRASAQTAFKASVLAFDERIKVLRLDYRKYLDANYATGGGAHPVNNATFFESFDHRFLHSKAIPVMVSILSKNLSRRSGNILAAAAAYNAGLSTTYFEEKLYAPFGRIPAIDETTRYISRILGNYFEIHKRISAV